MKLTIRSQKEIEKELELFLSIDNDFNHNYMYVCARDEQGNEHDICYFYIKDGKVSTKLFYDIDKDYFNTNTEERGQIETN